MVKISPTNFCRKCISRIVGDLEMPVYASVVGINPAVVPLAEKAFTLGGIKERYDAKRHGRFARLTPAPTGLGGAES